MGYSYEYPVYCDETSAHGDWHWGKRFTCNTYFQSHRKWRESVIGNPGKVFWLPTGEGAVIPVVTRRAGDAELYECQRFSTVRFVYLDELKNRQSDAAGGSGLPYFFNRRLSPGFESRYEYGYRVAKFTAFGRFQV